MWLVSKKLHLSNLVALMFFAKEMYWFLHLSFIGTAGALRRPMTNNDHPIHPSLSLKKPLNELSRTTSSELQSTEMN